jgi:hypothetical protein
MTFRCHEDDFKSLAHMKVSGEYDEMTYLLTNYNGEVSTTIFDKTIQGLH